MDSCSIQTLDTQFFRLLKNCLWRDHRDLLYFINKRPVRLLYLSTIMHLFSLCKKDDILDHTSIWIFSMDFWLQQLINIMKNIRKKIRSKIPFLKDNKHKIKMREEFQFRQFQFKVIMKLQDFILKGLKKELKWKKILKVYRGSMKMYFKIFLLN